MPGLTHRVPRPMIGVLPTGHRMYWEQFPQLKQMGATVVVQCGMLRAQ